MFIALIFEVDEDSIRLGPHNLDFYYMHCVTCTSLGTFCGRVFVGDLLPETLCICFILLLHIRFDFSVPYCCQYLWANFYFNLFLVGTIMSAQVRQVGVTFE